MRNNFGAICFVLSPLIKLFRNYFVYATIRKTAYNGGRWPSKKVRLAAGIAFSGGQGGRHLLFVYVGRVKLLAAAVDYPY